MLRYEQLALTLRLMYELLLCGSCLPCWVREWYVDRGPGLLSSF